MTNRNNEKGRLAENATALVFQQAGLPGVERRAKRGGYTEVDCWACRGGGWGYKAECPECDGHGTRTVHRDAGDLAGIPGVVVQVKWSGYASLTKDLAATEDQRLAGGAQIGLLVRKRHGVGLARAAEWDAYLPTWQLQALLDSPVELGDLSRRVFKTDLWTAARLIAEHVRRQALADFAARERVGASA